jgi:HEAT repeat protein
MKLPDSVLAMVLLVAVLTAAAPAAFPEPPKSRAEALAALTNADTATRAEAVVWIANRGSMADAPLLHERLRDESAFVRGFAEQGLWPVS